LTYVSLHICIILIAKGMVIVCNWVLPIEQSTLAKWSSGHAEMVYELSLEQSRMLCSSPLHVGLPRNTVLVPGPKYPPVIGTTLKKTKRAQRSLGRSPEEKVKCHSGAINRGPLMLSTRYWWRTSRWCHLKFSLYKSM